MKTRLRITYSVLVVILFAMGAPAQWVQAGGPGFSLISVLTTDASGNLIAGCDDRILNLPKGATTWTMISRRAANSILWKDHTSFMFGNNDGLFHFDGRDSSVTSLQSGQVMCLLAGSDSTIFCSTNSGVSISKDKGKTWTGSSLFSFSIVYGLARDTSGSIVAGAGSQIGRGGGLYRTTDNGGTWTQVAFGNTYGDKVWINSKNTYFYHGYRSTDKGNTWLKMPGDYYGYYNMVFLPGDTIYATTSNQLYVSLNDGVSWTFVDSTKSIITTLHAAQSGALYVGTASSGVHIKMLGESSLRPLSVRGLPNGMVFSLAVDSDNSLLSGAALVSAAGGVYRVRDNGQSWDYLPLGLLEARGVIRAPDGSILVGNAYGGIFKSTDNGRTWKLQVTNLQYSSVWTMTSDSKGNIFAGLINYGVTISTDNGDTWTHSVVRGQTYAGWSLAAAPDGGMYVGTQGGIFYSSDLGQNWRELGLPGAVVNTILLTPNGSIFLGSEAGDIWRSTNKGANWSNVVGQTVKGKPKCSAVNSRGHIFIGTSGNGVFRSMDNGDTWTEFSDGLTEKTINVLAIDSAGFLLAATTGDGLFRTIQSTTPVEQVNDQPRSFALLQNYPNPFNPSTTISYSLPRTAHISLRVFNTLGQEVATLVNEHLSPGFYRVKWNANVPSGIYFYRLQAGQSVETKKMILLSERQAKLFLNLSGETERALYCQVPTVEDSVTT